MYVLAYSLGICQVLFQNGIVYRDLNGMDLVLC